MPGGELAAVTLSYGHPTMNSRSGAAKSVWDEIPPLRGGEPPDVVTRAVQSVGHTRNAGVSARDPDTGLSRPRGKRRGPTPPNR